jgi:nicotinate phosphoribosyltransferase
LPQELFTDLYELTMAQAYHAEHMDQVAVFELAYRQMPANRNYIVVNGLTDVLNFLNDFHFSPEDVGYLRGRAEFSSAFLSRLEHLQFTGACVPCPKGR